MDNKQWCWIKGEAYNLDLIRKVIIHRKVHPSSNIGNHIMIEYSNGDTERIPMDDEIMCDIIEEKLLRKTR